MIEYNAAKFRLFTKAKLPSALQACHDSRAAVKYAYPACFGTVFHPPAILFNGSLDTLNFASDSTALLVAFCLSLKPGDSSKIQSIAVHAEVDPEESDEEIDGHGEGVWHLNEAAKMMPNLKEAMVAHEMYAYLHYHGVFDGEGPIELYDKLPELVQDWLCRGGPCCPGGFTEAEVCDMPDESYLLRGFNKSKVRNVWSWRTKKLRVHSAPWMRRRSDRS